eukprot:CCRYP_015833-RA/>CCRYP_015833-RA protein AED:0.09 eAED:0.09 QI:86/0.87/0.77/1/0/0/9/2958/60
MKKKEATSRTTPCDRSPTVQRELTASPAIKEYEATVRETKIITFLRVVKDCIKGRVRQEQ